MFKLLTKSFLPILVRPRFVFSDKKDHLIALSHQLLTQHQTLKGWKTVRLLHSLTMARYDPEVADVVKGGGWREEQAKTEQIISSLSGELHIMPHREVNMLLEVLKERGYRYDRTLPIFKALNKVAKLFFGRQFKASQLTRSLQLYKQLYFPKQTWVKMVDSFLQIDLERSKKDQNLRMNVLQFLRLAILVLQEQYVPLQLVKSLVERLTKENASNLDTLTTLYHISRILPNCLKAKVQYQLARTNARDVLFNPYSQLEEEQNTQKQSPQQSSQAVDQSAEKQSLRVKLNQASSEIMKHFFSAVDTAKLEQSIIKSIQSDIEPLTKQCLLFASDIPQLKSTILKYLQQNLQKLTPIEFMHLLRKVPSENATQLLKSYYDNLGVFMSVNQKIFFHVQSNRFFHIPMKVETIISVLQSTEDLKSDEFMGIMKLVGILPQSSKQKMSQILSIIKRKIKE